VLAGQLDELLGLSHGWERSVSVAHSISNLHKDATTRGTEQPAGW
jgi:hypothetical protein